MATKGITKLKTSSANKYYMESDDESARRARQRASRKGSSSASSIRGRRENERIGERQFQREMESENGSETYNDSDGKGSLSKQHEAKSGKRISRSSSDSSESEHRTKVHGRNSDYNRGASRPENSFDASEPDQEEEPTINRQSLQHRTKRQGKFREDAVESEREEEEEEEESEAADVDEAGARERSNNFRTESNNRRATPEETYSSEVSDSSDQPSDRRPHTNARIPNSQAKDGRKEPEEEEEISDSRGTEVESDEPSRYRKSTSRQYASEQEISTNDVSDEYTASVEQFSDQRRFSDGRRSSTTSNGEQDFSSGSEATSQYQEQESVSIEVRKPLQSRSHARASFNARSPPPDDELLPLEEDGRKLAAVEIEPKTSGSGHESSSAVFSTSSTGREELEATIVAPPQVVQATMVAPREEVAPKIIALQKVDATSVAPHFSETASAALGESNQQNTLINNSAEDFAAAAAAVSASLAVIIQI